MTFSLLGKVCKNDFVTNGLGLPVYLLDDSLLQLLILSLLLHLLRLLCPRIVVVVVVIVVMLVFTGDCKEGLQQFYNILLIIRFFNFKGVFVTMKRCWVNNHFSDCKLYKFTYAKRIWHTPSGQDIPEYFLFLR